MVSVMKAYYPSQTPRSILIGAIFILASSLGITRGVLQAQQASSTTLSSLTNGTHLYGEAPQPDQINKGYVVFSHRNGRVVGALYYPRSEFDCFAGSLKNDVLDVKSIGAHSPEILTLEVNLSDLHSISALSQGDQQMLSVCRKEMAEHSSQSAQ